MELAIPVTRLAATYASVVNAVHIGAMKKIGILKEGTFTFEETLGSAEEHNKRLDTGKSVPFLFRLEAVGDLMGLFDPTNEAQFLTWEITDDSYVTLPGIAESAAILRGSIRIVPFERMTYHFDFNSHDGRLLTYHGEKDLGSLSLVKNMCTLKGEVRDALTGETMVESTVFSGQSGGIGSAFSVIRTMQLN